MTIYNSSNNFQPGLIGPFSGWKPSSYGGCYPSINDNSNNICDCGPACDVTVSIDLGLTSTVGFDWNNDLHKIGDCKIVKSEWFISKEASVPLEFDNEVLSNNISSIQISGGVWGGEYTVINKVCTEEGNELQKIFCVTVKCDIPGDMINVNTTKPVQTESCKVTSVAYKNTLHEGMFDNDCFSNQCICCLTLVLVKGSASIISNGTTYPITSEGITVNNDGMNLEPFIINVLCDSVVHYQMETC